MKVHPASLLILALALHLNTAQAAERKPSSLNGWLNSTFGSEAAKPAKKPQTKKTEDKKEAKKEEPKKEEPKKAEAAKPEQPKAAEQKPEAAKAAADVKKEEPKKEEPKKAEAAKPVPLPKSKPAEAKAADAKPVEGKSTDSLPADPAKPADKAADKKATTAKNDSIKRKFELQSCAHKVHGNYSTYGQAPYGCDANMYESEKDVIASLNDVIFDEKKSKSAEAKRYTTNMFRFMRDASDEYIKKRNRNASTKEIEAFRRGVMSLAHQESYWSHYRISAKDSRLKVMKGDEDWSFGMMQVHGRWHGDMVRKVKAWTLSGNLAYGMDIYYHAWELTKNAKCVKSQEDHARAAYSVYNAGGVASACRWKNSDDKWARNDKGFYEKWKGQMWAKFADKQTAELASPIDVACLFDEGGESCLAPDAGGTVTL